MNSTSLCFYGAYLVPGSEGLPKIEPRSYVGKVSIMTVAVGAKLEQASEPPGSC